MAKSSKTQSCELTTQSGAFKAFATHQGKTESARHIKPLHWYVACRLVIEGGFHPEGITPRPPLRVEIKRTKAGRNRYMLSLDPNGGGSGEQVILGGLKTKNVDVVVCLNQIGPVLAVSCKGVTKSFRNLTNRMEETIGECTNLHITYPAMVVGYYVLLRANRTPEEVAEAPNLASEDSIVLSDEDSTIEASEQADIVAGVDPAASATSTANDLAISGDGGVAESIKRFHSALCQMTGRTGIRDEISRYEAMAMVLVEPKGETPGGVFPTFPEAESPLHLTKFFGTLYQRYEERFVYGAPLLAERGMTTRFAWDPASPVFSGESDAVGEPSFDFDYEPRLASD